MLKSGRGAIYFTALFMKGLILWQQNIVPLLLKLWQ
nr:MAG TPA: hypothetical protein [Caudoviricetes sp.]